MRLLEPAADLARQMLRQCVYEGSEYLDMKQTKGTYNPLGFFVCEYFAERRPATIVWSRTVTPKNWIFELKYYISARYIGPACSSWSV